MSSLTTRGVWPSWIGKAAPDRLRKGAGRYPQPVALLARLGVDTGHEARGLGAALLVDAVGRMLTLSEDIGCRPLY